MNSDSNIEIFKTQYNELYEKVVCAEFVHTTNNGGISNKTETSYVKNYNLDMIISVGYRVNSKRTT